MSRAYYNENDPRAAAWLRELIAEGLIAHGDVDDRSIAAVTAADLAGYGQCHFFAGIGGWSLALRLAGWPDDGAVWSGSCPCQPYSVAGAGLGDADPRNLWPEFRRLIGECKPAVVLGEQVASPAGRRWLAGVFADLEGVGYAVAGADLCAAGVTAPHIRQRLYWVADAGLAEWGGGTDPRRGPGVFPDAAIGGDHPGRLADLSGAGQQGGAGHPAGLRERAAAERSGDPTGGVSDTSNADRRAGEHGAEAGVGAHGERGRGSGIGGAVDGMAYRNADGRGAAGASLAGSPERDVEHGGGAARGVGYPDIERCAESESESETRWAQSLRQPLTSGPVDGVPWDDCRLALRRDPKRGVVACRIPAEPLFFPLADGFSGSRVGLLRGAGNAIVPHVAAEFVRAYLEAK